MLILSFVHPIATFLDLCLKFILEKDIPLSSKLAKNKR